MTAYSLTFHFMCMCVVRAADLSQKSLFIMDEFRDEDWEVIQMEVLQKQIDESEFRTSKRSLRKGLTDGEKSK